MQPATQQLDRVFAALADPTRRAILARLAKGEATVNQLVAPFELSQPTISKHLKVLEGAGLITRGREAQWRPCKIEPQALKPVDEWLENYRRLWEQRLDRLEDYLRELQAKQPKTTQPKSKQPKESKRGRKK
jgi:DNA-binding transcriptional ArsR family regulator